MALRVPETIFIQVGIDRKKRLLKACKLTKLSQAKFVHAALDKEIKRLAKTFPQLQEQRNGHA